MAGGEGLHLGHRGGGGADDAKEPREQWPESPIAMRGVHTVLPEDSLSRASSSAGVLDHQAGTPHKQPRTPPDAPPPGSARRTTPMRRRGAKPGLDGRGAATPAQAAQARVSQVLETCAADLQRWAAAVAAASAPASAAPTAAAAAASWMRAGCALRAGGELDGARSPVSESTLALLAHACGGAAATARLWHMPESAAQPLCVASSDSLLPPASLLDPSSAQMALHTKKICPVLLTGGDVGAAALPPCEQQTVGLYAGLRAPESTEGLNQLCKISNYVLEVVLPHDSFDASSMSLASKAADARDHEMSAASAVEVFITFIALSLPWLLRPSPLGGLPALTPTATPVKVRSTPSRAQDAQEQELQAVLDTGAQALSAPQRCPAPMAAPCCRHAPDNASLGSAGASGRDDSPAH